MYLELWQVLILFAVWGFALRWMWDKGVDKGMADGIQAVVYLMSQNPGVEIIQDGNSIKLLVIEDDWKTLVDNQIKLNKDYMD